MDTRYGLTPVRVVLVGDHIVVFLLSALCTARTPLGSMTSVYNFVGEEIKGNVQSPEHVGVDVMGVKVVGGGVGRDEEDEEELEEDTEVDTLVLPALKIQFAFVG